MHNNTKNDPRESINIWHIREVTNSPYHLFSEKFMVFVQPNLIYFNHTQPNVFGSNKTNYTMGLQPIHTHSTWKDGVMKVASTKQMVWKKEIEVNMLIDIIITQHVIVYKTGDGGSGIVERILTDTVWTKMIVGISRNFHRFFSRLKKDESALIDIHPHVHVCSRY